MEVDPDLHRALIVYHSSQRIVEADRNMQGNSFTCSPSLILIKTLKKDSEIDLEIRRKLLGDMPFQMYIESLRK